MRKIIYGFLFLLLAFSGIAYSAYSYYGPTFENEHLYRIAIRIRPNNLVSIQQMMVALLNANPTAFNQKNINGLKSGYRLRIPPSHTIRLISPLLAERIVNRQNIMWKQGVTREKVSTRLVKSSHKKYHQQQAIAQKYRHQQIVTQKKNKPIHLKTQVSASPTKTTILDIANQNKSLQSTANSQKKASESSQQGTKDLQANAYQISQQPTTNLQLNASQRSSRQPTTNSQANTFQSSRQPTTNSQVNASQNSQPAAKSQTNAFQSSPLPTAKSQTNAFQSSPQPAAKSQTNAFQSSRQPATNTQVNASQNSRQPAANSQANYPQISQDPVISKLPQFMEETKNQQEQTKVSIANLQQQTRNLQGQVNQLNNELRTTTYHFIQTAKQVSNKKSATYNKMLLDNFKQYGLKLIISILLLIVLLYLFVKSLSKPKIAGKKTKGDGKREEYDFMNSQESIPSKLDLARAYMDMGDYKAAENALKDVMKKGNKEQKEGARDLLGKLNVGS